MAIRVFTVCPKGIIKPGADAQTCVPLSGEPLSGIVIDPHEGQPRFLPIKGLRLQDRRVSKDPVTIQMVEVDLETMEISVRSQAAKADNRHALVVFSVDAKVTMCLQTTGSSVEVESGGVSKHAGPLRPDTLLPSRFRTQFAVLLEAGKLPHTVFLRDPEGPHVETMWWDGHRLWAKRSSLKL